jgi:hypothetical protein
MPSPTMLPRNRISMFCAIALLLATSLLPRMAHAHSTTATITCSEVAFYFEFFPPSGINVINEVISVDGVVVAKQTYKFTGTMSSNTVPIAVPAGTHTVTVHADWDGNGAKMAYDTSEVITCECASTFPNMSTAKANGSAYVLSATLLGTPLIHTATASSSQTGPGSTSNSAGPAGIHLSGPIDVEVLRATSGSSVNKSGANDESVATVASVNLLNLVTATAVRADARALASPTDARTSFAGSYIVGLTIAGTVINGIYPNMVVPLPGGGTTMLG